MYRWNTSARMSGGIVDRMLAAANITKTVRKASGSWSIFDSLTPGLTSALGRAGTGGSLGFNLTNESARFHDPFDQFEFVQTGSEAFKPYGDTGNSGNGSGKMPGFGVMLTKDMIQAIVEYERDCLAATDPSQPAAAQSQPDEVTGCDVRFAKVPSPKDWK